MTIKGYKNQMEVRKLRRNDLFHCAAGSLPYGAGSRNNTLLFFCPSNIVCQDYCGEALESIFIISYS
jgi:hypothetical protein